MTEREQIAERLKEARVMSGLSQENAAKILQIQRPAISEIESGKRKVSAEEIIQFAKLYKVSTSWLLLKEENESALDEQTKIAARELGKMDESDRKKLLEILRILPK
ncbi:MULTISPECIES: helix-turn-helix domain-containing protein [Sphingobacterium]|uniref:Helix-turn-helix transcriptional regulator n=2 Tax=Bacteroidota/Chlorobiota group TaxID=68336 RepID=A0ABT7NLV3_9SPHI|nr:MULTISPECIES: helix-turn-helix transcriptional regulator [Sphingobacterium]MCT1531770.1 helix-turn-helix domain-containing protein [Sphingobacterium daejeonense]MDM1048202.1 helix-turn-helix transcriptional regulator [Sphingobacterium hotanense]